LCDNSCVSIRRSQRVHTRSDVDVTPLENQAAPLVDGFLPEKYETYDNKSIFFREKKNHMLVPQGPDDQASRLHFAECESSGST